MTQLGRAKDSATVLGAGRIFFRGVVYWLVALSALEVGAYYSSVLDGTGSYPVGLFVFAVFLLPCFVIYAGVYDSNAIESPGAGVRTRREAWRGLTEDNGAVLLSFILCLLVLPIVRNTLEVLQPLGAKRLTFLAVFLVLNLWYALFLRELERRNALPLFLVRYETFTPVLLIALYFFLGATIFQEPFRLELLVFPVFLFLILWGIHRYDRRNLAEGDGGRVRAGWYAFVSILALLATALSPFLLLLSGLPLSTAQSWSRGLVVSFALALYLSLFELWRLTFYSPDRLRQAVETEEAEHRRRTYYEAALVSHAVALVALPLLFAFGGLGLLFLVLAVLHALVGFWIWYRSKGPQKSWSIWWLVAKLSMALTFFGIFALDLRLAGGANAVSRDLYPSNLSGMSASLFVAILVGVMATPFAGYLMQSDERGERYKARPLLAIVRGFFRVPERRAVFRLLAVLSGLAFISTNFLYEAIHGSTGAPHWLSKRMGLAFWVFAVATLLFSLVGFFVTGSGNEGDGAGAGDDRGARRSSDDDADDACGGEESDEGIPAPSRSFAVIALGIVQSVRLIMGLVIFASVFAVGVVKGGGFETMLWLASAVTLVAMGSFALNDFYDASKDRINAPHRAVPSGRLRRREAFGVGLACILAGSVLGVRQISGGALAFFLLGCLGALAYNEVVRRAPAWKVAVTAALCALILVFDVAVLDLGPSYYWVCLACFVFAFGRELLMDVRDVIGDSAAGLRTLAVRLGTVRAERLGYLILCASTLPVLFFVQSSKPGPGAGLTVTLYVASVGLSAVVWFGGHERWRQWTAVELLKLSLLCGIALMVL